MKRYLPLFVAGLLILPITFDAIRQGALLLTVIVTIGLSGFATFMAKRFGTVNAYAAMIIFTIGAMFSEVYFFVSWYVLNTPDSPRVVEGATVAAIVCGVIGIIGMITIALVNYFINCLRK